jgi:hypothetical protein
MENKEVIIRTEGLCKKFDNLEVLKGIDIDIYKGDVGAPTKEKKEKKKADGEKPEKKAYGEYQHVKLTEEELAKLVKKHGQEKAAALVKYLDEYMEEKPSYKSASHYLAICRWVVDAVNEKARRGQPQNNQPRQAARGGKPGTVGPNGIAIDQAPSDMAGAF